MEKTADSKILSLNSLHNGFEESLQRLEDECKRAATEVSLHLQDIDTVQCGKDVTLRKKRKTAAEKLQGLLGQIERKRSKIAVIRNMLDE